MTIFIVAAAIASYCQITHLVNSTDSIKQILKMQNAANTET